MSYFCVKVTAKWVNIIAYFWGMEGPNSLSLCPNWLIDDATGIESVFIDFKVLYWNNN